MTDLLNLKWDDKEDMFSHKCIKKTQSEERDLQEYLDFLIDIGVTPRTDIDYKTSIKKFIL